MNDDELEALRRSYRRWLLIRRLGTLFLLVLEGFLAAFVAWVLVIVMTTVFS